MESVLYPSKVIRGGYEQEGFELDDESIVMGTVTADNPREVTVMKSDGTPVRIPKSRIQSRKPSAVSVMSEGLQLLMDPAEFADLILYLENLKKAIPGNK